MLALDQTPGTLRIRTARVPNNRERLRLERALGTVTVPETGLLVVRRIATGRTSADALGPAIERRLVDIRAHARRPWRDPAAAMADAVLFADEAELLACFARDWLTGRVAGAWFWCAVFGTGSPERLLRVALIQNGAALPAAFALLAAEGTAVAVARQLPEAAAEAACMAIAASHGLRLAPAGGDADQPGGPGTAPIPPDPGSPATDAPVGVRVATPDRPGRTATPAPAGRPLSSSERRLVALVPEIAQPDLSRPQRRLLAMALALARAPGWTRADGLAAVLTPPDRVIAPPQRSLRHAPPHHHAAVPAPDPVSPAPFLATQVDPASDATHPRHAAPPRPAAPAPPPITGRPAADARRMSEPAAVPRAAGPFAAADPSDPPIPTGFGGLFYLLNVALALGLYGDFTQPLHPGLALSPWDFLVLAGRRWFGPDFLADPACGLLARLAGRGPGTPPGAGFRPPDEWCIPADWLDPWGAPAQIGVHVTRTRLVLWHPVGFAIAQAHRSRLAPLRQARALLRDVPPLAQARLARVRPPVLPRSRVERWLAHLLSAVAARLGSALDVPAADAPALLCRHAALLRCGPTRIEIELSLNELPVAIRLAGLDRDPGWIQAAGRRIAFRFA